MKKRIAIWMHGGIGTGHFDQGIPTLEKILDALSEGFDLVVYSQSNPNESYRSKNFSIRSAPRFVTSGYFRWALLIAYLLKDHLNKKFSVIFSFWGYPAGLLAVAFSKIVRVKCIVYLLGSDSAGIPSIGFGILHRPHVKRLAAWAYTRASCLLAITHYQVEQLRSFGINLPCHVIPWGAESIFLYHSKTRGQTLHILHVAHLTPVKDQITLLNAFAIITKSVPAELRIIGSDTMQGVVQQKVSDMNLSDRVSFLGMIPHSEVLQHHVWADVLLHTSLFEGQSMAITEAAASGLLLAGTRVGLLSDLGDSCGVIVSPGEYEKLASKLLMLAEDPLSWNMKLNHAREWSLKHDLRWTILELSRVLDETGA